MAIKLFWIKRAKIQQCHQKHTRNFTSNMPSAKKRQRRTSKRITKLLCKVRFSTDTVVFLFFPLNSLFVSPCNCINNCFIIKTWFFLSQNSGKLPTWCMECTPDIIHYCLNGMLKDHCCCDARHGKGINTKCFELLAPPPRIITYLSSHSHFHLPPPQNRKKPHKTLHFSPIGYERSK